MISRFVDTAQLKLERVRCQSTCKMSEIDSKRDTTTTAMKRTFCASDTFSGSRFADLSKLFDGQIESHADGTIIDGKQNEEPKLSKEESQETRHWKDLLLLHLDLIQQQQELLQMKDRQIQQLTNEKETLRCRLERMERRMTLLRSGGRGDVQHQAEYGKQENVDFSPAAENKSQSRGIKRKNSLEPHSLMKKFATIARNEYQKDKTRQSLQNNSPTVRRESMRGMTPNRKQEYVRASSRTRAHTESQSQSDPEDNSSQSSRQSQQSQLSQQSHKNGSTKSKDSSKNKTKITVRTPSGRQKSGKMRLKIPKNDHIMHTNVMYYVPQEEIVPMDISPKKANHVDEVAVPTFRIKVLPRGYTMEGTENLGDEIYLKRHQKPECEEKRRKRWDMQRMREQKAMEQLRQSRQYRGYSGKEQEEDFESFLPDPDKIQYIEITDDIPVSAFGFPIPKLEQIEFDLPWFDLDRREREEKLKLRSRKR